MKIEKLGKYISEVSVRNKNVFVTDVFSVTNSLGFIKSTEYFSKEVFSKDVSNYKIVGENEFAYNPSRINVGSIDYLKQKSQVVISPLYVVFRCKNELNQEFLKVFLKSPIGNSRIRAKTKGAVRDTLSFGSLCEINIPILPVADQLQIANLLSKTENLIAQRKESIRLLDELLKSTFLDIFGDPVTNEKNWVKIELKNFGEIITGNTPPRNNHENYSSNFIEWIKTDNIPVDDTYITKSVEYLSESGLRYARTVEAGALLVACIAGSIQSVGRAALTNRKVSFNQQINAIQPNEEIEPLFLYWLFKISRKYVQDAASNGMKKILTKGSFEKIKMIKPPIEIQTHFANIVGKTEVLKTQYQQSLQELENLYGVLSQKAFKGELKIRTEVTT